MKIKKSRRKFKFILITIISIMMIGCGVSVTTFGINENVEVSTDEEENARFDEVKSLDDYSIETEEKATDNKEVLEIVESEISQEISISTPEEVANKSKEFTIPEYVGNVYVVINDNIPFFDENDMSEESYEYYSELDSLGRCGVCVASVGQDIMPTVERGEIGNVKPSGWNQNKYIGIVEGNYLYNRCHLIGYQLTGENANVKNLITGTRALNVDAMLLFENMVADYVKETGNHVMYRVTPVFEGDNLLASGVLLEGKSVEDEGEGILFCVYCYNVQNGIDINYFDGSNSEKSVM